MLRNLRNTIVSRIAKKHVAGSEIENALQVCRWAEDKNFSSILSLWTNGENTSGLNKRKNFERFKSDLVTLNSADFNAYYSFKLDAIGYDFDLFRALLVIARGFGIRLHVDSLDPRSATAAFRFFERASEFHEFLGCTLPSRWKRSLTDAERAIDLGLSVRIVKGQWKDPGSGIDCRTNYLSIAEKLAGRAAHVGVATHDSILAGKALKCLSGSGSHYEMEQFFSLPLNGPKIAEKYKCPYRIYVAYGYPAIPYNYRFAGTRPALAAWMVTDFVFNSPKPWMQ